MEPFFYCGGEFLPSGGLIYDAANSSLLHLSRSEAWGSCAYVSVGYVAINIDSRSRRLLYADGYLPLGGAGDSRLSPPSSHQCGIFVSEGVELDVGIAVDARADVDWRICYDSQSGWVRIGAMGSKSVAGCFEYSSGQILALNAEGKIEELWLKVNRAEPTKAR